MYHVSTQGVDQCMINVHYYLLYKIKKGGDLLEVWQAEQNDSHSCFSQELVRPQLPMTEFPVQ